MPSWPCLVQPLSRYSNGGLPAAAGPLTQRASTLSRPCECVVYRQRGGVAVHAFGFKQGCKTESDRFLPFGERVLAALRSIAPRIDTPILVPAPRGGYIDIEKFRYREWTPALRAAGVEHRRINDLRHTYAS
jgi:integrase